jgi:multidrug transporter EmrE-like cation transporter
VVAEGCVTRVTDGAATIVQDPSHGSCIQDTPSVARRFARPHADSWRPMRFLLASSLSFTVGGMLMKPAQGFTRLSASLGVGLCFLIGAALLTVAVHRGTLGTTYVIGLGMEALLTFVFATLVLGEQISARQTAGVVVAVVGLLLLC